MSETLIDQVAGRAEDPARERVARLFQFVAALYERRNPATRQMSEHEWILRLSDIPKHQTIDLTTSVGDEPEPEDDSVFEPRPLLRCARPIRTDAPEPPDVLVEWLDRDWEDCRSSPSPIESINRTADGQTVVQRFDADPARVQALGSHRTVWDLWAVNEKVARAAGEIFERLYALYGKLQRDGERVELVISDGLLAWTRPGGASDIRY